MTLVAAKILVVDADPTARILFQSAMTVFGFEVSLAVNGVDALRQFRANSFDLVMLEIDMPGMSGHEVCTTLRSEADPLLPILMVTGMDDVQSVERAYRSGATDFIVKPMNWALIGHRVKYLLRGHQALHELRTANFRHAAILQAIPDSLFELDSDGRYIDFHSTNSSHFGVPVEGLLGKTLDELHPPMVVHVCMSALQAAHKYGACRGHQLQLVLPQGVFWFELSVSRKEGALGQLQHFIVLSRDITERKAADLKILQLAWFDSLTGLANRRSFHDRVEREIRRAQRAGTRLAILFMDLDGFKNINDTMGHGAGDQALQLTAARLGDAVRPADMVSRNADQMSNVEIARLGGDEFTVMLLDIKRPEDALVVAHRILHLMHQPFMLNEQEVVLTASIGIALYGDDGEDVTTLLKHADTAMYLAKDSGRDNCQFYSPRLTDIAMQRLQRHQLEGDLRLALDREELTLHYQPQICAATGRIHAIEALVRWNRPGHGRLAPLAFIPAAEHCGLIIALGQWVLHRACTDAVYWQSEGHPVRVAVNLSPLQFKDPNLVPHVFDVLMQVGLAPDLLELEVTESAVMDDSTMAALKAFQARGVKIALDDFGTGYSSLSCLKRMPLSHLKIDQSFVTDLPDDMDSYAIVRAILVMADSLGLNVTAEGVETFEQSQVLRRMGCNAFQGYFFSKPVSFAEIPALLSYYANGLGNGFTSPRNSARPRLQASPTQCSASGP